MAKNKKILNAHPKKYNGIEFKSITEVMIYKTLVSGGFTPKYEKIKFTIWEGFKPTIPFYDRCAKTGMLSLKTSKLINTTYTPDFTFNYNNHLIIIEAKGIENDVFPIKKKLFRKLLEDKYRNSLFFEVRTKRETLQAIDIIKNLK